MRLAAYTPSSATASGAAVSSANGSCAAACFAPPHDARTSAALHQHRNRIASSPRRRRCRSRRDPRRRPGPAAAGRTGPRSGRDRARSSPSRRSRCRARSTRGCAARRARAPATARRSRCRPRSAPAERSAAAPSRHTNTDRRSRRARTRRGRRRRSRAAGSQRPRRSKIIFAIARMNARSPGRAPPGARPSASRRRTASASKPTPAEKQNRRPFTEPSEIRRSRDSAIAAPAARAASTGSRGTPSARGRTLVPPPGRNPNGTSPSRAVQRLVVGAVAREDEDRIDIRRRSVGRELGGVAGTLRELGPQVDPLAQRVLDLGDPGAGDVRRVGIDDQERALHACEHDTPHRPDRRRAGSRAGGRRDPARSRLVRGARRARSRHDPLSVPAAGRGRTRRATRSVRALPGLRLRARPRRAVRGRPRVAAPGAGVALRRPDGGGLAALARAARRTRARSTR